jgi:O-antigen/teichoic acid export membrane protein
VKRTPEQMNKAASKGDQEFSENLFQNLRKDTLRYIPSAIVPAVLSIAGISVFTRLFDPLEYGRYAVVMAASTLTAALLSGWMEQSVLRYLPRFEAEDKLTEFVMRLFVILKGLSLTVLLAAVIAYPLINESLAVYAPFFYPAVLLILGVVVFSSLNAAFQAELRSKESSLFKVSVSTLRLGFALFFVFFIRKDVIGLVIGAAAANLLLVVPMLYRLGIYHNIRLFFKSYDSGFLKMFAAYGIPMVGWMLCGQILSVSDRFIIGAFRGS